MQGTNFLIGNSFDRVHAMSSLAAGSKTRVKACTECRQQKLKCDAVTQSYAEPCSRCCKLNLTCVIARSFRRVKRRTKLDLEAEVEALRQRLQEETASEGARDHSSIQDHSPPSLLEPSMTNLASDEVMHIASGAYSDIGALEPNPYHSNASNHVPEFTKVQILDDLSVNGAAINDCFESFLQQYLPYAPVVGAHLQPNHCHDQSPFLFWSIVAIGSRRYTKDPTLIVSLGPKILELAKHAAFTRHDVLPTIQALVLLCVWPMPFDTLGNDVTPMLAGAMLQLAMTVGLHVYGVGQDFSRTKVPFDRWQRTHRTILWTICMNVSQSMNITSGLPPSLVLDTYDHEHCRDEALAALSPALRFHRQLIQLHSQANIDIVKEASSQLPESGSRTLTSIIESTILKFDKLGTSCTSKLDKFDITCARLHVLAVHLLEARASIKDNMLSEMYIAACTLIELAATLDRSQRFADFAPQFVWPFLHLAAFLILRIGRSHICDAVDLSRGQTAYFSAIHLHKRTSVRSDDIYARSTMILTQLWTSKISFRRSDSTADSLFLRCTSRLGMSVVYDSYWLWRQEFGGQPNPYEGLEERGSTHPTSHNSMAAIPEADFGSLMDIGWSSQGNFPDYQWPAFDDNAMDNWTGLPPDMGSQTQHFYDLC